MIDWGNPAVRYIVLTGFFFVGAALGSFLNVCFWRIPRGESVVTTPSHCTSCNHRIAWYDNLPIASFLILRGHCRYCGAPYSPHYFFVELITALIFTAFAATGILGAWTPHSFLIPGCAALYFAIAIAWFDFAYRVIPGGVTLTAFFFGIILAGFFPPVHGAVRWDEAMIFSAASGISFYLALAFYAYFGKKLARREVLGGGDIKAMAAIAALLGWKGAVFILFAAALSGCARGIFSALRGKQKLRDQSVAFGVDLAIGIALWCFAKPFWLAFAGLNILR